MIAGPALGAISWFGMVDVTASYHVLAINALLILALGHSAVAIFHQLVLKDGLLLKMIRPN
jgi:cytochrome b561